MRGTALSASGIPGHQPVIAAVPTEQLSDVSGGVGGREDELRVSCWSDPPVTVAVLHFSGRGPSRQSCLSSLGNNN